MQSQLNKAELWEKETAVFKVHAAFLNKYNNSGKDPKVLLSDLKKRYNLWIKDNLPFSDSSLVAEYLDAASAATFIAALKKEANDLIRDGFDPKDARQVLKAFIGVRMLGVDIKLKEFEERLAYLLKYDEKYPGSFKSLFIKSKALRSIEISTTEVHEIDTSGLEVAVFDEHLSELRNIKAEIDSFLWFSINLPGHKQFNARNFYHRWKRDEAIAAGTFNEKERFNVQFPEEEKIKEELL
ncbi:MAG: hypothetical protein HQL28_06520, partial [Candidatus Omnitrophica bacterium]|nr:hypothetical protein [Candidatus Omnitrophota bacterium]